MEENEKKASRIFYLSVAAILTFIAVLIIAFTVAKSTDTTETTDSTSTSQDTDASLEESNKLPVFSSPMKNCALDVDYSDTVLVFSPTMKDYRTHTGIDLTGNIGQEVFAVADGVVKNIWQDPFMGTCISIEHSGNAVSYYKNLDPVVKEGLVIGTPVARGEVIGAIGESAMNEVSQDPHLHFELKVNDKHVNPKDHIELPTPEVTPESGSNKES